MPSSEFKRIRDLIEKDEVSQAIEQARTIIPEKYRDHLSELAGSLKRWQRQDMSGLAPKEIRRRGLVFHLLKLVSLSEIEFLGKKAPTSLHKLSRFEGALADNYAFLIDFYEGEVAPEDVLAEYTQSFRARMGTHLNEDDLKSYIIRELTARINSLEKKYRRVKKLLQLFGGLGLIFVGTILPDNLKTQLREILASFEVQVLGVDDEFVDYDDDDDI
ncbi:MAG: hypothetical protein AAFV07_15325 [Bacteroidota bacterium]